MLALTLALLPLAAAPKISPRLASAPEFAVTAKYAVGGEGGWDYVTVDSAAHRLYIPRGTHVMVLDEDSGKIIGDVAGTEGVHGVAVDERLGRGFTSNGRANTVTVFDLKTLATLGTIPVGQNPDAIAYDAASNRIVTCNGRSNDLSVVDPKTMKLVGTVKLAGRPEAAASDGAGFFVNIEDKSLVERVDLKAVKSLGTWSFAPGEGPSGIAVDTKRHVLFSVCSNGVMVAMDDRTGKILGTPRIGEGPDAAGYDPKLDLAFASNGEGTLTVVGRDAKGGYAPVGTVPTAPSARTMALDARTHRIYLASATPGPAVEGQRRRPMVPGSFTILVVAPKKEG